MTPEGEDENTNPGEQLPAPDPSEAPADPAEVPADLADLPPDLDGLEGGAASEAFEAETTRPNAAMPRLDEVSYDPASDPGLGAGGAATVPEEATAAELPAFDTMERLPSIIESLLLASDHPLSVDDIVTIVGEPDRTRVDAALLGLAEHYAPRGIQLHNVAGGWQLRTQPLNAHWVQKVLAQKPVRLSRAQLETLAIVGYRQPITRPEIEDIRGVDSGATVKTLLERQLVRVLGKKEEPGRALLFGTTKDFLEFFNLRDLKDLPSLREYHELSEEHRAQVAALEGVATPGTIEPEPIAAPAFERVDLPEVPEEDMGRIDALIDQAGQRAQAAVDAMSAAAPVDATPPSPPDEPQS